MIVNGLPGRFAVSSTGRARKPKSLNRLELKTGRLRTSAPPQGTNEPRPWHSRELAKTFATRIRGLCEIQTAFVQGGGQHVPLAGIQAFPTNAVMPCSGAGIPR